MKSQDAAESPPKNSGKSLLRTGFRHLENLLVTLSLGGMVILPLAEVVLRKLFQQSISGVTAMVQHLVLVSSVLGAAVAAREDRLLAMSTVTTFLHGRWKIAASVFSGAFAIAISVGLATAGTQYVLISREAGKILAYGVPVWVVQAIMPLGFAVIGWRILRNTAKSWKSGILILALSGLLVGIGIYPPFDPENLVLPALLLLVAAIVLGAPIFSALGGAALILIWGAHNPIASIAVDHYRMVLNPSLGAIPLFTLAGYFLAEGGASKRLINVFQTLVGRIKGGPVIVTALVCAFFTSFTGASGVTILALGGLLMPVLVSARYSEKDAIGLLTSAGSLGLLFPPCLPLILFAVVATSNGATVTIKEIFLGGVGPGILIVALTAWWGVRRASPTASKEDLPKFDWQAARRAIWAAKWELLLPVVALTALFGGFATPVEAAAVTALYAFIVETFIYRDLKFFRDTTRVMTECGLLVGGVLLILGVAMGFNNYLIDARLPDRIVDWVSQTIESRWLFLLSLNFFLLLVGCVMDIFSAIVVVVPLIIPMSLAFGIDPIHLGIIFLANLELGYLTPPVGMNLFLSAMRFKKSLPYVYRSVLPLLLVRIPGVLLITYFPPLTLILPGFLE